MSAELERAILGALILSPALLETCDLRDLDFPAGRFRKTFSAIVAFLEETQPTEIDPVLLVERVGGDGASIFIGSLMDGAVKLDESTFRARVSELRRRGLTTKILTKIERQAKGGELDLGEIWPDLEALDKLRDDTDKPMTFISGQELKTMDLRVEWVIEKLIPEQAITIIHGPGGLGKTWLLLQLAKAVSEGTPFLNLQTKKKPVYYCDFESPAPVLVERVRTLDINAVLFKHAALSSAPPKLDSKDWVLYKKIPPGMLIADSFRSFFDGDENSTEDVAPIMARLKQIRDFGFDVLVIHHNTKDEKKYRGSTAIVDLADHVLDFHRCKRENLEEEDDAVGGFDPSAMFSLGTGGKTRYTPAHFFLNFDPSAGGYCIAEDPKAGMINQIAEYLAGEGCGKNQSDLVTWAKKELEIKKRDNILALLKRGEMEGRWRSIRSFRGARIYEPV